MHKCYILDWRNVLLNILGCFLSNNDHFSPFSGVKSSKLKLSFSQQIYENRRIIFYTCRYNAFKTSVGHFLAPFMWIVNRSVKLSEGGISCRF